MTSNEPLSPKVAAERVDRALMRASRMLVALHQDPALLVAVVPHLTTGVLDDLEQQIARVREAGRGERLVTAQPRLPTICGHCQKPQRGLAAVNDTPLCHPDEGLDCYHLVTVYRHPIPCRPCPGEVGVFTIAQALS